MPRAVLLHGTDGSPDYNWFPWLEDELARRGYEVFSPLLPDNHTPNRDNYENFLRKSGWDFSNNLIIGHSSGATTALNLLDADWFPVVKSTILVGLFLNERLLPGVDWYEAGQFDKLFPENGYDIARLQSRSSSLVFLHGSDDPYCSVDDARDFAEKVGGRMEVIDKGLHLSSNRTQLPEILKYIDEL